MTNYHEQLRQPDMREFFRRHGTEPWTVVYRSWRDDDANGALFAAFSQKKYRQKALNSSSWDLRIGGGLPGFMQSHRRGRARTTYLRYGNSDGIEPIVLIQEHHDMKPRQLPQVSEEFRLFHNLWVDPAGQQLIKVADDGSEFVAAEIRPKEVKVRTSLLRKFQAARQLDLLLFIDSILYVQGVESDADLDELSEEKAESGGYISFHARVLDRKDRPFSRFLAKKVILSPPRKKAGIWPYEDSDDVFPEFIIGEDDAGSPILHTCDPDRLANYFGKNPDAPHYLTPVFFRRDVLHRYYEHPEKFSVEDGYLRCGGLWNVRLDNDHPEHVMVFLGDLGHDLPAIERGYWRAFNIAPVGQMSLTNFRRAFLGQFTDPKAVDLQFNHVYVRFRQRWSEVVGWELLRQLEEGDEHVLQRLRVPLSDSDPEFEGQILNLAKLLVDSLNEAQLGTLLATKLKDEKGISKLKRWLKQQAYPHTDRDIAFLRNLQSLRSRSAAHRKGSDYQEFLTHALGDVGRIEGVAGLIRSGTRMLEDLAIHFRVNL